MGTNFVMVAGEIFHDPEIRGTGDKTTVNFVVPVDEFWTDRKTGEKMKRTEWMRCVVFDRNAQIAKGRLKKGMSIVAEGSNRTEDFIHNGREKRRTKIVCGKLTIIDGVSASSPLVFTESDEIQPPSSVKLPDETTNNPVFHSSKVTFWATRLVRFMRSWNSVTTSN